VPVVVGNDGRSALLEIKEEWELIVSVENVARPAGHSPAVLVVEDEFLVRKAVADELSSAGYTVHEAADYTEALDLLLAAKPIDLVLTDIAMPGPLDGNDLIRVIRTRHPSIIVIAATVTNSYGPVEGLLRKPYDPAEAVMMVHRLLKAREQDESRG
jgi:two-component system, response regulator PdtaR